MGTETKHAGGRPLSYSQDHIDKARDYLDNWQNHGKGNIPQIARLAIACDIALATVYDWEKRDECKEFAEVCARVRQLQHAELVENGLDRTFDSGLAKLMLNKHGYSDAQKIDHTTKGKEIGQNRVMVVNDSGSNDDWEKKLQQQQDRICNK